VNILNSDLSISFVSFSDQLLDLTLNSWDDASNRFHVYDDYIVYHVNITIYVYRLINGRV